MSVRSWLYVPGDRSEMLDKAVARGADALILDLEDAVATAAKDLARRTVARFVQQAPAPMTPELWIRVNRDNIEEDIRGTVRRGVRGVVLAKADQSAVRDATRVLDGAEHAHGLRPGDVRVSALVETARGLMQVDEIAAMDRVSHLGLGEADLAADLRIDPGKEGDELLPLRLEIVIVSAAHGLAAPIGPVSTDFTDLSALRRTTEQLARLGFRGRAAIHPAQVKVINDVFTPSDDEIERAERIVAGYEEAMSKGQAVFTDEDGRMVDIAVVRSSREVLDRARTAGLR